MPEFLFSTLEEIKEGTSAALDAISDNVDYLQERIVNINIINDYNKNDPEMYAKYSSHISELFGKVNALTLVVDEMTLNLNDVSSGCYDSYPTEAVSSLVMVWNMQATHSIDLISEDVAQLEKYIEYFKAINEDITIETDYLAKPTVH